MSDVKQHIKSETGEMDLECGPIKLKLKNAKWPIIIVSIGIMFAIIIYAHSWYRSDVRKSRIRSIAERFIKGKELSEDDVKTVESLDKSEREVLANRIEDALKEKEAPVPPPDKEPMTITTMTENGERFTVEQKAAPGTPVTIRRDGKKMEIRKGGP